MRFLIALFLLLASVPAVAYSHHPRPHHPIPIYTGPDGKPLVYNTATCDSVTDVTATIQNEINTVQSISGYGGTVQFGPSFGACCVKSGLTVSGGGAVRLVGDAESDASLSACGADVTVVYLSTPRSSIENIVVVGKGAATGANQLIGPNY